MDSDHGDPEIQVLAEGALLHHLFEIPAGGANHPDINGMETFEPSRSTLRSCSTRKSLACSGRGRSPISSRKTVPPLASSKRPRRIWLAPVNAPFSCPKSSSSIRDSGKAQAENATNGLSARWLRL